MRSSNRQAKHSTGDGCRSLAAAHTLVSGLRHAYLLVTALSHASPASQVSSLASGQDARFDLAQIAEQWPVLAAESAAFRIAAVVQNALLGALPDPVG
jgi:hypothetical protein